MDAGVPGVVHSKDSGYRMHYEAGSANTTGLDFIASGYGMWWFPRHGSNLEPTELALSDSTIELFGDRVGRKYTQATQGCQTQTCNRSGILVVNMGPS